MILKSSVPHRYWARKVIFRSINPLNVLSTGGMLVGFITIPIRYDSTRAKNEKEDGIEDHGSKELTSFVQHTRHIGRKMWGTWRLTCLSLFSLDIFRKVRPFWPNCKLTWQPLYTLVAKSRCRVGCPTMPPGWNQFAAKVVSNVEMWRHQTIQKWTKLDFVSILGW